MKEEYIERYNNLVICHKKSSLNGKESLEIGRRPTFLREQGEVTQNQCRDLVKVDCLHLLCGMSFTDGQMSENKIIIRVKIIDRMFQ